MADTSATSIWMLWRVKIEKVTRTEKRERYVSMIAPTCSHLDLGNMQDETMEENQGDFDDDQEEFGDDDYVQNYFEPGEGDDLDDGGGDDEGGGESPDYANIPVAQVF